MIFLCFKRFSTYILSLHYFKLIVFVPLFDTILKRYKKEKKEIFYSSNTFLGAKPEKNKENVKKLNFRFFRGSVVGLFVGFCN